MLIDTHCHLTSAGLVERIDAVLGAAWAAGVTRIIQVAVNLDDARSALNLMNRRRAEPSPELFLVAGIHPHEAGTATAESLAELRAILGVAQPQLQRIVGVGETGLDFHYDFAPRERQEEVFRQHIQLAQDLNLPVVIHSRESEVRVCEILAEYPALARDGGRVVFHCFSGDVDIARRALDLGCYLSFTGVVTFKKASPIQAAAQFAPSDRIMIETDAPWLSPEPLRKIRPNEPALLVHTARFLARLCGVSFEALTATTTANAVRFFGLPEQPAPGVVVEPSARGRAATTSDVPEESA